MLTKGPGGPSCLSGAVCPFSSRAGPALGSRRDHKDHSAQDPATPACSRRHPLLSTGWRTSARGLVGDPPSLTLPSVALSGGWGRFSSPHLSDNSRVPHGLALWSLLNSGPLRETKHPFPHWTTVVWVKTVRSLAPLAWLTFQKEAGFRQMEVSGEPPCVHCLSGAGAPAATLPSHQSMPCPSACGGPEGPGGAGGGPLPPVHPFLAVAGFVPKAL